MWDSICRFYNETIGKLPWQEQLLCWVALVLFVWAGEVSRDHMTWGGRKRDD